MNEDVRSTIQPGLVRRYLKFPLLEREYRVALAERISKSSAADVDFVMMMALAAVLASWLALGTVIPYQAIPDLRVKYASKSKPRRIGPVSTRRASRSSPGRRFRDDGRTGMTGSWKRLAERGYRHTR